MTKLKSSKFDEKTVREDFLRSHQGSVATCLPLVMDLQQIRTLIGGLMAVEHHLSLELGVKPLWPGTEADFFALRDSRK